MNIGVETVSIHPFHLDFGFKQRVYTLIQRREEQTVRCEDHFIQHNREHDQTEKMKEKSVRLLDVEHLIRRNDRYLYNQKSLKAVEHNRKNVVANPFTGEKGAEQHAPSLAD